MLQTSHIQVYNPFNLTQEELMNIFVVRTSIFKEIFEDIKCSEMKHPEQHYIIQGVRGQGKTTLLLRIYYEIERDRKLGKKLIPVIFNEEQYNIRKLYNLWETTADLLEERNKYDGLSDKMEKEFHKTDYEMRCFEILETSLKKNHKKLILFIDNIGMFLEKLDKKDQHRLREVLIESSELRIIGASSSIVEFSYDYGKPFFEFFKISKLKGLNFEETKVLLLKLGELYNKKQIKALVDNNPGRIEALRRLTGGVIRTIVLLFEIFIDEESGSAFIDLEKILDNVTPLYKHRMDDLSPPQQQIVDVIAINWDAMSTKDIAIKTRMQSKVVAAQLNQLQRNNIIEKQATSIKNNFYRISERFFNIWYLMRQGRRKDVNKVRFLAEFLEIWCSKEELQKRALKHLDAIEKGSIYHRYALYFTEAISKTAISYEIQDKLIKKTREYVDKFDAGLLRDLSESYIEISQNVYTLMRNKKYESALKELQKIINNDNIRLVISGYIYNLKGEFRKAEEYYLKAAESGNKKALNNIGVLYHKGLKDFKKAEEYYLKAVESGDTQALVNISLLYHYELKEFKKAEEYYLEAVKSGDKKVLFNIALLYHKEFKDFKKAEEYYYKAVEGGDTKALKNIGVLYNIEFKDFKKAEKYYIKAIKSGDKKALFNIALLYHKEFKEFKKAEEYYLKAVESGDKKALTNIAVLYDEELKEFKKAEEYYLKAVESGDKNALFNIALLYHYELKEFRKAEEYYLKAIESGHTSSLFKIAFLYHKGFKDFKKAEEYYLKAVDIGDKKALANIALLYHKGFKDFKKAEEFYLRVIEGGDTRAYINLGNVYREGYQDFKKAEEYYLKAVDSGEAEAYISLGNVYFDRYQDFKKAKEYYLKAAASGHTKSLNNLAWMFFQEKIDKIKALEYAEKSFKEEKTIFTAYTYSTILLWNNDFEKAYKISKEFIENPESFKKFTKDITLFLMLLISKKQYHLTLMIFNENPFDLKNRLKPVYYALMYFMHDDYPNEYRKMGEELKQTVEEIIEEILRLEKDYE